MRRNAVNNQVSMIGKAMENILRNVIVDRSTKQIKQLIKTLTLCLIWENKPG